MSEIFINKARTVALTGHRVIGRDFDREQVKELFISLINDGYDTFLDGMAIGFDIECCKILLELRKKFDIRVIGCIPCPTQAEKFNYKQKEEYTNLRAKIDGEVVVSLNYTDTCMKKRNEFMVDNASLLLAYLRRDFGGTANTVNYARKNLVKTVII